jgi:uncharacterized protein involved in outer membrane biogenesis
MTPRWAGPYHLRVRRIARYCAYAVGVLLLVVLAAALLLPQLLDRPGIAAQLQAKLSSAVDGEVRWDVFRVRILPSPHGSLQGLKVKTEAMTLTADEVTVALRLWPLFHGRAEVASVTLKRPRYEITLVPAASVPEEAQLAPAQDPLESYRSVMRALADHLQEFTPDTVVAVDNAAVQVNIEGIPPLEFSDLSLRARTAREGVELDGTAKSRYWTQLKLAGRMRYADLSSTAEVHLSRVQGQAWLDWLLTSSGISVAIPDVDLDVRFAGDAAKALELDVNGSAKTLTLARDKKSLVAAPIVLKAKIAVDATEVAVHVERLAAGATSIGGGVLRYSPKDGIDAREVGLHVDLAQVLGYGRELVPQALERIDTASGALKGRAQGAWNGDKWRLAIAVEQADAAVQVKDLPGPFRLESAAAEVDPLGVRGGNVRVSMPAGSVRVTNARYAFKDGAAAANGELDLDMAQALALARTALPDGIVESAGGRLRASASGEFKGKSWTATAKIAQSDAQVKLNALPAALTLSQAGVRATPKAIIVDGAAVKLLDANATASATISDYTGDLRVKASAGEATIGPQLLEWVWHTAALPANLALNTPVRVVVPRFGWSPDGSLEVDAQARFAAGPQVAVELIKSAEGLDVRHVQVKDGRSDASVSLQLRGGRLSGRYSGTLDSRTVAAMLKSATAPAGAVSGDLRFAYDPADPRRTTAEGNLKGEHVDLSWAAGVPAEIERLDLSADGSAVRIAEASVQWAGQRASLRGEVKRGPEGPIIDAQVESPGVLVDALLPKPKAQTAEKKPVSVWPLPVTGRIAVRSKLVRYQHYEVAPLAAIVVLEKQRIALEVNEALVCGLAVPLTAESAPGALTAAVQIAAQKQKIEQSVECLAGEKLLLTGPMDLRIDVRTQGENSAALLQNLKGTVSLDIRNGSVTKFALLGNILSMQNVAALISDGPKLGADAFPFRQLSAKGRFDKGRFHLDEGVFHSNAIGLGANGSIGLADFQSNLTVLVAPLALVDEAVRKLPVLGYVVGGTFTSLPVAVNGDIRDPRVVPLGPRAITNEMMGLLTRTLSLPGKAVSGNGK